MMMNLCLSAFICVYLRLIELFGVLSSAFRVFCRCKSAFIGG